MEYVDEEMEVMRDGLEVGDEFCRESRNSTLWLA